VRIGAVEKNMLLILDIISITQVTGGGVILMSLSQTPYMTVYTYGHFPAIITICTPIHSHVLALFDNQDLY
jgi:hypothetical protein